MQEREKDMNNWNIFYIALLLSISILVYYVYFVEIPEGKKEMERLSLQVNETKSCQALIIMNGDIPDYNLSDDNVLKLKNNILERIVELRC